MKLELPTHLAKSYKSKSQIARVITESWVAENAYCPNCGQIYLSHFENNRPVADFFCANCREEFELKSKQTNFSTIINDGAYDTMIRRLESENNLNFFFLNYSKEMTVINFILIPKHFFTPKIVIKRKPLSSSAQRAGWIGCNIDISHVPEIGKIFLVRDGQIAKQRQVQENFQKTLFLRNKTKDARGWTLDILNCIDRIPKKNFTLSDVYAFEKELQEQYPNNHFVKDKIRQQLQVLRDKNIIEFIGRGQYRKLDR